MFVHEATYPLTTEDFAPVIDAVAESDCDLLFLCSYLDDSIGSRARHPCPPVPSEDGGRRDDRSAEHSGEDHPRPAAQRLRELRILGASPEDDVPRRSEFLNTLPGATPATADVDLLGHYMAPLAYAQMQVVAQAVEATGGFDDASLSTYARSETFHTVMGEIRFGAKGEWAEPRVLADPVPERVEGRS